MDEELLEVFSKLCPKCNSEREFRKQFCSSDSFLCGNGEHLHARCQECGYKAMMPCYTPGGKEQDNVNTD